MAAASAVGMRVLVTWCAGDGQEQCEGWIVFYEAERRKHIVVYDRPSSSSGRRVYSHAYSAARFRAIDGDSQANRGKAWSDEDIELLCSLEKRIQQSKKRLGSRYPSEERWLWYAAACALGRFQPCADTACGCSPSFNINQVKREFLMLVGMHGWQNDRGNVKKTGVTGAMVRRAIRALPEQSGTINAITAKVEELFSDSLGKEVASDQASKIRWQSSVMKQLTDHPRVYLKHKGHDAEATYTLCSSSSYSDLVPRQSSTNSMDEVSSRLIRWWRRGSA